MMTFPGRQGPSFTTNLTVGPEMEACGAWQALHMATTVLPVNLALVSMTSNNRLCDGRMARVSCGMVVAAAPRVMVACRPATVHLTQAAREHRQIMAQEALLAEHTWQPARHCKQILTADDCCSHYLSPSCMAPSQSTPAHQASAPMVLLLKTAWQAKLPGAAAALSTMLMDLPSLLSVADSIFRTEGTHSPAHCWACTPAVSHVSFLHVVLFAQDNPTGHCWEVAAGSQSITSALACWMAAAFVEQKSVHCPCNTQVSTPPLQVHRVVAAAMEHMGALATQSLLLWHVPFAGAVRAPQHTRREWAPQEMAVSATHWQ